MAGHGADGLDKLGPKLGEAGLNAPLSPNSLGIGRGIVVVVGGALNLAELVARSCKDIG